MRMRLVEGVGEDEAAQECIGRKGMTGLYSMGMKR